MKKILLLGLGSAGIILAAFLTAFTITLGGVSPDNGGLQPVDRMSARPSPGFRLEFADAVDPFTPERKLARIPSAGQKADRQSAPKLPPPSCRLKGIAGDQAILEPVGGGDSLFVSAGETVNGLVVEVVGPDFVVLSEKGRRYRVGLTYWESAD
jgi:hypothetical protein